MTLQDGPKVNEQDRMKLFAKFDPNTGRENEEIMRNSIVIRTKIKKLFEQ